MKTKQFAITMLFCIALANMGCGGKSGKTGGKSGKVDTTVVDTTIETSEAKCDTVVSKPNSATLLFDASGSMHGYLNSSDSRFIGVVSAFVNMPNQTVARLYGTNEGDPINKDVFDSKLNKRDIAWSNESDLMAMVGSMISHVETGDDVCLLVTDGILSGSDADIKASPDRGYNIQNREKMSQDLIAKLGSKTGNLCALAVRYNAKFNGKYSCYNNSAQKLVNKERPFFVFVLGKWGRIKYIENKLNEIKTSNGVSTPYEDIVMIGDAVSYKKMKLSAAEGLNPKDGKLIIKKEFRSESIALSSDLGVLPAYMCTEDYFNSNIELFVQYGQNTQKPLDKKYYEVSVDKGNTKTMLKLSVKSSQLKDAKLTFKLKYALPEWIEQKSDDNDLDIASNPSKLGKTFNLKYFMAGFAALHEGKYIKEQNLEFK